MARVGLISLVAVLSLLAFQPIFAQNETTIFVIIVNNKPVHLSVPANLVGFITEVATQSIETANTDPNTNVTLGSLDIDECGTGVIDKCSHTVEKCVKTEGAFLCVCVAGFIRETIGGDCVMDLCFESKIVCDTTKQCNNDETDLQCICGLGFHMNEVTNVCEITTPCFPNPCPTMSRCHNKGHFECECVTGYNNTAVDIGAGAVCEDIDECSDNVDTCDGGGRASCTNTKGSFECACAEGYSGDGTNCTALWKPWGVWSECSSSCSPGLQVRKRLSFVDGMKGNETRPCNTELCDNYSKDKITCIGNGKIPAACKLDALVRNQLNGDFIPGSTEDIKQSPDES